MTRTKQDLTGLAPWIIFLLGLGIFLWFKLGLLLEVNYSRALPPEVDDAYCYIIKTTQIQECFRQDCTALNDLRVQLKPSQGDDESLSRGKWRLYHIIFRVYHPLYSLAHLAVSRIFQVSFETAYIILSLLGCLGISLAIAMFLVSITDLVTAGITLASLSLTVFHGQGLQIIVPSNLTMGIALLMFAYLIKNNGHPGITFYILNLLTLGTHPIGCFYIALAVILGVLLRYSQPWREILRGFIPSLILIVIYWILNLTISHPDLAGLPQVHQAGINYLTEVWCNFRYLIKFFGDWYANNGLLAWPKTWRHWVKDYWMVLLPLNVMGVVIGLLSLRLKKLGLARIWLVTTAAILLLPVLLSIGTILFLTMLMIRGFMEQPDETIRQNHLIFGVLSAALFLSCFHVIDRYPAELLKRLFTPWAIVAGSFLSRGLVVAMVNPGLGNYPYLKRNLSTNLSQIFVKPSFWHFLLIVFLVIGYGPRLIGNYEEYKNKQNQIIDRFDFALDPIQPNLLQEQAQAEDIILYEDPVVMTFFLSHGGLGHRAVFVPLLPLPYGFDLNGDKVKFIVGFNPYLKLMGEASKIKYPLPLSPGGALKMQLMPEYQVESVEILSMPGNLGPPGRHLLLEHRSDQEDLLQDLKIDCGKWEAHYLAKARHGGELILRNQGQDIVYLAGLRLQPGNDKSLNWPWKGIVRVSWQTSGSAPKNFSPPQEYYFAGRGYRIQVLEDGGASVLGKLMPIFKAKATP